MQTILLEADFCLISSPSLPPLAPGLEPLIRTSVCESGTSLAYCLREARGQRRAQLHPGAVDKIGKVQCSYKTKPLLLPNYLKVKAAEMTVDSANTAMPRPTLPDHAGRDGFLLPASGGQGAAPTNKGPRNMLTLLLLLLSSP